MQEGSSYCSFLLRLWRSGSAAAPRWRVSLEDTRTGERHTFADMAQMMAFLERPLVTKQVRLEPGATDTENPSIV